MQAIAVRVAVVNFKTLEDQVLAKTGEVKELFETLAVVNVYMVIDTLSDSLAKAEIETLNERKARTIRS